MSPELETPRLRLRPFVSGDALALAAGIGNPSVALRLDPVPLPYTKAMATDWIAGLKAPNPHRMTFAVELAGTGLIGSVAIESILGYWLDRAFWGLGYASEACRAALSWHFANTDAQSLDSNVHADNPASLKVQKKLGFKEVGRFDQFCMSRQCSVPHIATRLSRAAFEACA